MAEVSGAAERLRELIELDLIRVVLGRVRPRVTHERLECDEVATALTQEPICEAVAQLMRGEPPYAGTPANAPDHTHQRLIAGRLLRILAPSPTLIGRYPLFHLDCEHVIVELGLQFPEARAQFADDVGIERKPMPMLTFAVNARASTDEIEVGPPTADYLGPSKPSALHEKNRRKLVREGSCADTRELVKARPVDIRLPFWRPTDLPRGILLD